MHAALLLPPPPRDQTGLCSSGVTVSVILDLPFAYCVWISSAVAIVYTLLGGLYSVAYTDVIQLALTFFSLVRVFRRPPPRPPPSALASRLSPGDVPRQWLCVPFLLTSPFSVSIVETAFNGTFQEPWVGTLELDDVWRWMDDFLMLVS